MTQYFRAIQAFGYGDLHPAVTLEVDRLVLDPLYFLVRKVEFGCRLFDEMVAPDVHQSADSSTRWRPSQRTWTGLCSGRAAS